MFDKMGSSRSEGGRMADKSAIEWTEATWNPTTGCDRISVGCDNCYAMTLAKRLKAMGSVKYQTDGDPRTSGPGFGVALHHDALDIPRRWREPRTVFVNSMSDLFHARVPVEYVQRVFTVMRETPRHTFQVLTKRAARLAKIAPQIDWPANVWMGVSVEDESQRERIDHLRQVPAALRFVSAEPLLGPLPGLDLADIDWLIAGGESGQGCRHMDPSWVRDLRDQCVRAGTAFFFKQWGGRTPKAGGRLLDGRTWDDMPTPRMLSAV
jgi:protein gp37